MRLISFVSNRKLQSFVKPSLALVSELFVMLQFRFLALISPILNLLLTYICSFQPVASRSSFRLYPCCLLLDAWPTQRAFPCFFERQSSSYSS